MANQEKFFVEYGVDTDATTSFKVPAGTTAQRDTSPESGLFRYNTSNNQFEGYSNGSWGEIGGSSLGQSFDVDTFTGDNSTTAFTLGRSVSSEDYLIVFIDGVFQAQDAYTLSGTTLTLDSPPATGSSIIAYSVVPISVAEIPADTDDLTEGSTNLYFTNARVDSRLSSGSVATIETSGNVTVGGDLSVSGGLTVSGTTTTVNSTTTSVTDSMIELANSNTSSDVIDIGIYGNYDDGLSEGGVSEYTGLFRDASDSTWKLFDGLEEEPTTTVNTAGTNYAKAALEVGDLDATTILTTDINLENTGGNAVLDIISSNTGLSRVNLGDTDGSTRGGLKYDHSDDSMAFRANGSDQMTLTNTGLGIGTDSPADKLHVAGDFLLEHGAPEIHLGTTSATHYNWKIAAQDAINKGFEISSGTQSAGTGAPSDTYTPRFVIEADTGDVGIGTSSPSTKLHVSDSSGTAYKALTVQSSNVNSDAGISLIGGGGSDFRLQQPYGSAGLFFYDVTNSSERMRIGSSGDVGIGTSSPTSKLHVDAGSYAGYAVDLVQGGSGGGNHGLRVVSSSGSSYTAIFRANASTVFYVDGAGNYYFSGSNQSDINKKENIADITDSALDLITQLQPKTYNFIGSDIDKAGFIAQDMEQVIPRLVTGNEFDPELTDEDGNNPTGKGIDYMGYTAYLTKAIQEQQTIIDDLKARIETLENA